MIHRSYLFAPGHNERLLTKVFDAGADMVILDLEDAVPAEHKVRARHLVAEVITERRAIVRINAPGSPDAEADLEAVADNAYALRVPKVESPQQITWVAERAPNVALICAIESARGLLVAPAIAASPGVTNLGIGGVDLRKDLHLGRGNQSTLHARSVIATASAAAGLDPPIDGVYPFTTDTAGLREEAEFSRMLGYFGKNAIHPNQLETIHLAFTPNSDEIDWAREVLAAFDASGGAVTRLGDGEMIDAPVAERAQHLLALAHRLTVSPERVGEVSRRPD